MILRTLHGKLSVALLALLFVSGLLHISLTFYTTRGYVDEVNQNLNRALASDLAKHLIEKNLLRAEPQIRTRTKAEIKQSMVLNPDIEIYILDADGAILDYSAAPGAVRSKRVSLDPIQRFLAALGPLPILGDDPRHPGRQKIFSTARIPLAGRGEPQNRVKGYIYIILGGEKYDAVAEVPGRSYVLRLTAWSIAGSLSFVALAGVLLFGFLTRRLRELNNQMEAFQQERFADGTVAGPLVVHRGDEIERMRGVFQMMSERILAQMAQREQLDAQRREAVTNVSHDLRTPIAALQGYLETLLMKEGQLPPDEQRKYLSIALKHAERLGKLIAALFELGKLDSREMQLALEEFSPAELVQDVTQQFQLAAQNQNVSIQVLYGADVPFVRADIGLVERALENLIENALHHTPSGGLIEVALQAQENRVQVQVKDNGEGIGPEHLPHVFERSYRAHDRARESGDEDSGAGLGLAITRRIVELHGGQLTVQSTLGQGATFSFDLPLATNVVR